MIGADRLFGDSHRRFNFRGRVVHRGIEANEFGVCRNAVGLRDARSDFFNAALNRVTHFGFIAARCAAQKRFLRNDACAVGVARLRAADRNHRGQLGIDGTRDNRLQCHNRLAHRDHRVARKLRTRAVTALAFKFNFKNIGVGGGVTRDKTDRAHVKRGLGVQRIEFVNAETLHKPIFNHMTGARETFFTGLENRNQGTREIAVCHEVFHHSQKRSDVAVVAAGVHVFGTGTCVRRARVFV